LNSIRESTQRAHALCRWCSAQTPDAISESIGHWLDQAGQRTASAQVALQTLADALNSSGIAFETVRDVYAAAKRAARDDVAWLFFDVDFGADATAPEEEERPLTPTGRPLTLGERKSLARGQKRELLELLLRDPHPMVVRHLLQNPQMTEQDVLAIATRRPQTRENLVAVTQSSKWICRRAIKRAVVLNPFSPTLLSLRLLPTMQPSDVKEVARNRTLQSVLCDYAQLLLTRWSLAATESVEPHQ